MKKNKTSTIGIIITIIILVLVVILSNINTSRLDAITNGVSKLFMPIQNGFIFIKNKITGDENELSNVQSLKEDNSKLREENSKLQEEVRELEQLKSENNTLKEYLNLKNKYPDYATVPGYVIERSYSNYDKLIIINVGANDGIKEKMPVISEQGLVGHIISVTDNTAKVQTIVDTASTVSANISTTNDSILLKGTISNSNSIKATAIPVEATVLQGDSVITSGLGGIYPKGILIGTIKEVINTKNNMDRYANVTTATDFDRLETVLVITQ